MTQVLLQNFDGRAAVWLLAVLLILALLCDSFLLADLLDEGHGESVPGDDAVVHQLHKGRQSEGQQVAKTKRRDTHTDTHKP